METQGSAEKSFTDLYETAAAEGGVGAEADPVAEAMAIGYSEQEIRSVPPEALMGLGCGNPTALAELKEGETVLDLGCGGGLDAFLAAHRVGAKGKVLGVDMTPGMVEKARENARRGDYRNVEFRLGEIEHLPIGDECIDVVISNCVINHAADKLAAYKEALRVLRPKGRILVSDLVTEGEVPEEVRRSLDEAWTAWITVALARRQYLDAIERAGFTGLQIVSDRPFAYPDMDERLIGRISSIQVRAFKRDAT